MSFLDLLPQCCHSSRRIDFVLQVFKTILYMTLYLFIDYLLEFLLRLYPLCLIIKYNLLDWIFLGEAKHKFGNIPFYFSNLASEFDHKCLLIIESLFNLCAFAAILIDAYFIELTVLQVSVGFLLELHLLPCSYHGDRFLLHLSMHALSPYHAHTYFVVIIYTLSIFTLTILQ